MTKTSWQGARTHPAFWIATVGGVGLAPRAPGTWGSIAALPIGYGLSRLGGPFAVAVAAVVVFAIGWWASNIYQERSAKGDPSEVVVDEVVGQWLALIPVGMCADTLQGYGLALALFRLLDIFKPWPISLADRRHDGLGIMLDDVVAGAIAAAALYGLCGYVV